MKTVIADEEKQMPMIDMVAPEGTFPESSEASLLERVTACLLKWEKTASIPLAVANTGAYLHVLPKARATAGGKADSVVRVQLLTPAGALKQEQREGIAAGIHEIIAGLAPSVRTWILFHEAVDGGWGIDGKAYTNAGLTAAIVASLKR